MLKRFSKSKILSGILTLSIIAVLAVQGSAVFLDKTNDSSQKVTIGKIDDSSALIKFNNVVSEDKTMMVKKCSSDEGYNYDLYDASSNNKILGFNSSQNVNFDDQNAYSSLAGAAVTAGVTIAGGGLAAAGAGLTAAAGVAGAVQGAVWLTAGSLSWVTTLQLAGAIALAANPVGVAIGAVGLA